MLDLNTHVADAIAKDINRDFGATVIGTTEVAALADGRFDTTLKDFYTLCKLYADVSADESTIMVIDGIAYCAFCGDQVLSEQCICTMN